MTSNDVVPAFAPGMIDARLFGTVRISVVGRSVDLKPKAQLLAAALFLNAGQWVPTDRLVEQVWGEETPADSRAALYDLVRDLRIALDGAYPGARAVVAQRHGAYSARIDPRQVDVRRFQILLAEAAELDQGERDLPAAAERYRQALDQWGSDVAGPDEPLAALRGSWAASIRYSLQSGHLTGLLHLVAVQLQLGQYPVAVPVLAQLAEVHPHNERVAELYMRALCGSGQPTDAQAVYRRLDAQLRAATGRSPGVRLQDLHQRILQGDRKLELPVSNEPPPGRPTEEAGPHEETGPNDEAGAEDRAGPGRRSKRAGHDGRRSGRPVVKNKITAPFEANIINFGISYGWEE